MNLWIQIMVIATLGIITVGCGSNNNKGSNPIKTTVNSAGQNVAEDGRIVLSSQAENDRIVIPSGSCGGCTASKQKIEELIANQFHTISTVSDFSFIVRGAIVSHYSRTPIWNASFTVQSTLGMTHQNIICAASFHNDIPYHTITLSNCNSHDTTLSRQIVIYLDREGNVFPINHLLYDGIHGIHGRPAIELE